MKRIPPWLGALSLLVALVPGPARADDSNWFMGIGAIHLGAQIGTADKAGNIVSGYFGGDYAILQHGVDLGVMSFLIVGAAVSTKGEVLFTFTPISVGTDHFQAGIDLIFSPARDQTESPFGLSLRIPLTFH